MYVVKLNDSELIMEVMNGAPSFRHTVIDTHRCASAMEFQTAIKYHEESLLHNPFSSGDGMERRIRNLEAAMQSKPRFDSSRSFRDARAHLVGWSPKQSPPKFPRDDSIVSKNATPESKGARPCRHCGSGKHIMSVDMRNLLLAQPILVMQHLLKRLMPSLPIVRATLMMKPQPENRQGDKS